MSSSYSRRRSQSCSPSRSPFLSSSILLTESDGLSAPDTLSCAQSESESASGIYMHLDNNDQRTNISESLTLPWPFDISMPSSDATSLSDSSSDALRPARLRKREISKVEEATSGPIGITQTNIFNIIRASI